MSIPFPSASHPVGFLPTDTFDVEDLIFDPSQHLQIEQPNYFIDLDFNKQEYPSPPGAPFKGLAFTAPFRVLSDEGVRVMRSIMDKHSTNPSIKQSDARTPLCLRGLGYVSPFVRDFNRSADVDRLLSGFAGEDISAHTMPMNYSQINVGLVGGDRPTDAWHFDSVDYVMVVILSDTLDMIGGELEVVMRPADEAKRLLEDRHGDFGPGETLSVKYPGAGYAILMQGSKMLHQVTKVVSAKEPRISLVNSYVSHNPWCVDLTRYKTFEECDPKHITPLEFARHRAWRATNQLNVILNQTPFPSPSDVASHKQQLCQWLDRTANELLQAKRLLGDEESDAIGYYDEVQKETVQNYTMTPQ